MDSISTTAGEGKHDIKLEIKRNKHKSKIIFTAANTKFCNRTFSLQCSLKMYKIVIIKIYPTL